MSDGRDNPYRYSQKRAASYDYKNENNDGHHAWNRDAGHGEKLFGQDKVFDGFPDNVTFERFHDNLDFRHEMEACLPVLPSVSIVALRKGLTQWGPVNITIPTLAGSA